MKAPRRCTSWWSAARSRASTRSDDRSRRGMIASHDPGHDTALRGQLAALAGELNLRCRDKWTIIGSAAAWLVGADVEVADIDVMTSVRDADTLLACWASQRLPV